MRTSESERTTLIPVRWNEGTHPCACLDTKLNAMLEHGGMGHFHTQLFSF
jgi:hypothetical protein